MPFYFCLYAAINFTKLHVNKNIRFRDALLQVKLTKEAVWQKNNYIINYVLWVNLKTIAVDLFSNLIYILWK